MRQIGDSNAFKLAFDFYDDNEARFCLRKINAASNPDIITEVFTVDGDNVGIGNTSPSASLWIGNPSLINSNGVLVISRNSNNIGLRNFRMGYDDQFNFCFGDYGSANNNTNTFKPQFFISYQAPSNCLAINASGNVGIGTTNPNAPLEVYSNIQLVPKVILSGTDFSTGTTSSSGVAFLLGSNLTNDRQFWIADSSALGVGTTNPVIRIMPNTRTIDAVATNGTTPLSLGIGNTESSLFLNGNNIYGDASLLNNFKFENNNQSNLIYPPPIGVSTSPRNYFSPSLSNIQAGTYIISASLCNANSYIAFNKNLTTEFSIAGAYSSGTGNYLNNGAFIRSTFVSGTDIKGEWLQLYYDKGFAANSITITGITGSNAKCPKDIIIAGSIEGSSWTLLSSQVGIGTYSPSNIISIYNFTSYNYYRLIVTKTISDTALSIADISFGGYPNTSFTPLDNYNILLYNTNEKQFPSRVFDTNLTPILTSNELFNVFPLSFYKEIITINNEGNYTLYTSSTYSTITAFPARNLFDNTDTNYIAYANGNYSSTIPNNYNSTSYIFDSTYKGDWIIVKFPYSIILTKFTFVQNTGGATSCPLLWKCYGSNDAINWIEITEASNNNSSISYTGSPLSYTQTITNLDIPFLYIGWIVSRLAGAGAFFLAFTRLLIFGKDDISNSYLNVWNKSNTSIFNTLGNVGIGTTNPIQKLSVLGNSYFNGNVGIGTTNPASTLSVIGNANITTSSTNNTILELSDGTNRTKIGGNNGGAHHITSTNSFVFNTTLSAGAIAIFRNLTNGGYDNLSLYDNTDACVINSTGVEINQGLTVGTKSKFSGNVGIGTTNPNASLEVYSNIQLFPKVILSGTDYSTNTTSSSGVAFLLGSNITNNRQLWIADSANIGVGTVNPVIRIMPNTRTIDAVATNGTTPLPLTIGNIGSQLYLNANIVYADGSGLNDLKLDNYQSNLTYPSVSLISNTITLSNNQLNNGTYIVSSSSNFANAYVVFDGNATNEFTIASAYNITVGSYSNSGIYTTSTIVNTNSYLSLYKSEINASLNPLRVEGEWIQIYYDRGFVATSFSISGVTANNAKCPKDFILAGSMNNSNWIMLSSQSNINNYVTSSPKTFTFSNFTSYNYYRLIIKSTVSDVSLSIAELKFSGFPNTVYANQDTINSIMYNTGERQFPPKIYDQLDATGVDQIPTLGDIYNIFPTSYFKKTMVIYTNGKYEIYSSSINNDGKHILFDYLYNANILLGANNYDLNGNISSSVLSTIGSNNNYYGDWIIIKMTYSIVLTRFRFYTLSTATALQLASAPGLWKCYGSIDGVNWIEITEASNNNTSSIATYNISDSNGKYYEKKLSSLFTSPYLYIGWVFNKLAGSDTSTMTLQFTELVIYGKTDISNAYNDVWYQSGNDVNSTMNIYIDGSGLNNLKLENNQPLLRFPPSNINSTCALSTSNSRHQNGYYGINSSTSNTTSYYLFDGDTINNFFSIDNKYATDGSYIGTASVTANSVKYNGEWIQLYYDKGFVAKTLNILGNSADNNQNPKNIIVFGSLNNSGYYNWKILLSKTNITTYSSLNSYNSYDINNNTSYTYYRLLIQNTIGSSTLSLREISFTGVVNTLYTNKDTVNSIIYNTIEKQFPPSIYSIVTTDINVDLNDIFYIVPAFNTYRKQIITVNNLNYTIYSSTANTDKAKLFDFNSSTSSSWAASQYDSNGSYQGSNYIFDINYKGDWIIIKFPYSIILTKFTFIRSTNILNAPSLWKCYGSENGINWVEITDASNITTGATYNATSSSTTIILSPLFVTPYLFIGWVFNKLVGAATYLEFSELQIFGKDDIANSTLNNLYNTYNLYPPKVYDSYAVGTAPQTMFFGSILGYPSSITINPYNNGYGIGTYYILMNSIQLFNGFGAHRLFDNDISVEAKWSPGCYTNGIDVIGRNIISGYNGALLIIRFPNAIILKRFIFYSRSDIINLAPAEWKCYGSNDCVTFTEITQANSSLTYRLTAADYGSGYFYIKDLDSTFNTHYLYYGWVFNKVVGTGTEGNNLAIANFQIFANTEKYLLANNSNPLPKLRIYETIGTDSSARNGSLIIEHGNNNGVSSIIFPSASNYNSDYGYIKYIDNITAAGFTGFNYFNIGSTAEGGALVLGCENDTAGQDSLIINPAGNVAIVPNSGITYISGNVGIGTTNPGTNILQIGNAGRLKVGIGSTDYTLLGTIDVDGLNNTRIVISGHTRPSYSGRIEYVTTVGDHIFYTVGLGGTQYTERLRIFNNGRIGIGTGNPLSLLELYSTSQTLPELILSGTDFATNTTSSSGIAFILGSNITNNRQLWIADSSNVSTGPVNPVIRIMPNTRTIDAVATNGTTPLSLGIGNTGSSLFLNGNNIYGDASQLNNFKFENNNQSNLIYPPPIGASTSLTNYFSPSLSNIQAGTYVMSASLSNANSYLAFDKNLTTNFSIATAYTSGTGNYLNSGGNITSTFVSGTDIRGEWLQLYYDKGFAANSITITSITGSNAKCPKDFIIAGSKEGSNWTLLSSQVGIGTYSPSNIISIYNFTSYNYYRLIVTKTISDASLSIADISFGGNPNTSFTPLDNYNILLYNTNEKQFPPRQWDVGPTTEILSSNEIFNITPTTYYKQQFSLNNHGTYTLYSSSTYNSSSFKSHLFDNNTGTVDGHWVTGNYTSTTGIASPANTNTIGLNSTYKGDWIIVKFPFPILLTRFRFYNRPVYEYRAPGFWRCYGSNDGVNWTEITDASNTLTLASVARYVNSFYEHILPSYFDIPYLYIGWVVNQLAGTEATTLANIMNFAEIQIFGKDDISNSYLNVWNKTNTSIFNTLGNVGIGTSNPTQKLTVVGNSYFNGNVGIGTTNPENKLTINNIPVHRNIFDHNTSPVTITHPTVTSDSAINDPQTLIHLCRDGTNTKSYGVRASLKLSRYENISTNSRTRLDLTLAHNQYDDAHIMSFYSSGNIGIGTTNPVTKLHIEHSSTSSGTFEGGLYVFNPINVANNCSIIGARIGGILANRAAISLDVAGSYGWNIGINGTDTTYKLLRFTNTYNALGTDVMVLSSNGNVGIGVNNPQQILDINGSLVIRAAESNAGGIKGIFFRDQYTGSGNYYNCSILTYNHANAAAEIFSDGLSINAWDGVSICTGSNDRQERMRVDKDGNVCIGTTTNVNGYKLNVSGSLNATLFRSNTIPIDFNSYATTTALTTASNTLQANINQISGSSSFNDASQYNNFKLENNVQSNLSYPPIGISTSAITSFTSALAQSQFGNYQTSASLSNANSYLAFDKNLTTEFSIAAAYSAGTGNYLNSGAYVTSTFVSGTDIKGEWLQLYYDKGFAANSITITGITGSNAKCPKDFIIAGSKEGSNWTLLSSQVGIGTYSPSNIISIYNFTSYNYYRLIVTKTISDATLSIADISLTGNPNTSFTPLDNYNIQLYNTNEKQFPPRIWDVTPTTEALSSNEIFNIAPSSYYKQQFSLNNHGTYTIYSSSFYPGSFFKSSLFNYNFSDDSATTMAHWALNNYNANAGTVASGNTNRIGLNNYYGDWIIVKFPFPIILTRFRFYNRISVAFRAPGYWRCYGSNDGVNWIEITDASNIPAISTIATYTITDTNGTYYQKTVLNLDIPYLYIGWVVNQLAGTDAGANMMNFAELQIFGKDDISNSYLNTLSKSTTTTSIITTQTYPPTYLRASTTTISGTSYGNGTYIATYGSQLDNTQTFFSCVGANPFNSTANPVFNQWTSAAGLFNTSGDYIGSSRTIINGISTLGEFGSVQFPYPIILTGYSLTSSYNGYHHYMMRNFKLCGSIDGINFIELDSKVDQIWTATTTPFFVETKNYTFTNTKAYLHYRFVFTKTSNFLTAQNYSHSVCGGIFFFGYEQKDGASIQTIGINTNPLSNVSLNVVGNTSIIGNVGIGTISPNACLELSSTIQRLPKLILSGQEFVNHGNTGENNFTSNGIAFLLGVNRTNNRQLWIANSDYLTSNTTNPVLRIQPNPTNGTCFIDSIATDNLTSLKLSLGNSASQTLINGNVGIGTDNPQQRLTVVGNSYFNGNVGIGTTTLNFTLQIGTGTGSIYSSIIHLANNYANGSYGVRLVGLDNGTNGHNLNIQTRTDAGSFVNSVTVTSSGSLGMGTTTPAGLLTLFSSSQLLPRIILSGQEYFKPYNAGFQNSNSDGIALLCGVNRSGNKQLWIGDSSSLLQNSTNTVLRLMTTGIDSVSTSGDVAVKLSLGNSAGLYLAGMIGIGTHNPNALLEVYSNIQLLPKVILSGTDYSTNTTSSSGVAFLLGSNITNNRQLWISDSANVGVGTINPVIRIMPNTRTIDAVATNGTTSLSLGIGNTGSSLFLNGNNIYGDASQLNNFKFENNNQSNLIYPPPIGASTSLTNYFSPSLSNIQAGTYVMSASLSNANSYLAFDKNLTTDFSIAAAYNAGTGNYLNSGGNITSTFVSGTDIRGEWLQLYYDKGFAANSITITSITGSNAKCPKDFIIAGSKEGSNWTLLSSQVGIGTYSPSNIISIYNFTSYNYYRLIVTKTISDASLSIADISFGGNPNTSFTPLDNYNILLYNTNEKRFPPRIWDVAPSSLVETSFNEIFNITPSNYRRQQFSLNNHGTYIIYSSSGWNTSLLNSQANLFNNNLTDIDPVWNPGNYANGNLAAAANTFTIGLNNSYKGDWIIVKFPFPIILTRFRFYRRNDLVVRAPGFWRCYGSNDGINWFEITEASNIPASSTIATYTITDDSSSYYYQKIISNLDIPYLYIGWVVNQLAGTNADANCINFAELQIFGKDDISNSYLNVWNKTNTSIFNTLGNVGIGTTNPTQTLTVFGNSYFNGNVGIGTTNPRCRLDVIGICAINNGNPYSITNNHLLPGALCIGDTGTNYGNNFGWVSNTAGLMMECDNNTEIAIHDNGKRVASFMQYQGDNTNKFTIGRDMGWGEISNINMLGNIGIGTTNNSSSKLCINANVSDKGLFDFATCPCVITHQTASTKTVLNDPQPILHLCRQGKSGDAYGQRISFYLSRFEHNDASLGSRTRCDIILAENSFENVNVMTLLSSGRVGIGLTNPLYKLDVLGTTNFNGAVRLYESLGNQSNRPGISTTPAAGEIRGYNSTGGDDGFVRLSAGGGTAVSMMSFIDISGYSTVPDMDRNIIFGVGGTERMRITNGTIGIGTTNPVGGQGIDCRNNIYVRSITISDATTMTSNNAGSNYQLYILPPTSDSGSGGALIQTIKQGSGMSQDLYLQRDGQGYVFIGGNSNVSNSLRIAGWDKGNTLYQETGNLGITANTSFAITFAITSGAEKMRVHSNGNIGIGIANPAAPLHVVGNIFATGDVAAYYSDIRLKNVTSNINNSIDIINSLNGFYYTPNDLAVSLGYSNIKQEIGLSAQDVKNVLPEIVNLAPFDITTNENGEIISKSGDNYLTLNYQRLVPVLIEGTKDLYKLIQQLQQQVAELTNRISILEAK
jgi:hypothetical protein